LRGYGESGVVKAIREAGGAFVAVTSEPQTFASEAQVHWELEFPSIGDPHHEIAFECRERGWLHLFVNRDVDTFRAQTGFATHPNGVFQPGILALASDGRVLYRWRSRPTRENGGGASNRPLPTHVWEQTRKAIACGDGGRDPALDQVEEVDFRTPPWPLFMMMLLANGNFLRPMPMGLARGGPEHMERNAAVAFLKAVLFVGAWAVAFFLFPPAIVLGALAVWAIGVTPGFVRLHRHFQFAPEGEPDDARVRDE
jgi:hypothetical protein